MTTGRTIMVHPESITEEKLDKVRNRHPRVTQRQHELVATFVLDGGTITAAAERCEADRTWAVKTLKKQHVQDYMRDFTKDVVGVHAARAVATMSKLLDSRSDTVKLEAAKALMETAGIRAQIVGEPSAPQLLNVFIKID